VVTAGTPFTVTVTAKDPYNNLATGFTGTAHFTSSDGAAVPPGDYTFTAADAGVHKFQPVLKTSGPQSLTVSAPACSNGQQNGIQVRPAAAAQAAFVQQPADAFAVTPLQPAVTVQVQDAFGNLVAAGVPVVLHLSNNPSSAFLAWTVALTNNSGLATFRYLWVSKAGQDYTLVARAGSGTSAPSAAFTIYAATHFGLSLSVGGPVQAGTSFSVTVTALDALNHPDPTYVGTVHFSSTAFPLVNLPSDYPFQTLDNGQHTFAGVMLNRAGVQLLTVADTLKPTARGTAVVTVTPGALNGFFMGGIPLKALHNVAYTVTVIAQDAYGNTVTGYLGTVQFSNAGGTAVLPSPYRFTTLDRGRHLFRVIFQTLGPNQSVTVEDQNNTSATGSETGITVS
jgi:hypothetical protein